ncbi:hypothetical protein FSP39_017240, partial [Pinctada imbricata]
AKVKKPRALKIKSLSPTIFKVKWRRPKQEKASIKAYKLSWRPKRGKKTQTVEVTSRSYIISGLETNTWYAVSVRTIDVTGRLSNQTSVSYKTSLSPVTYPPRNVTVKAAGTTKIKVTWMPPKRNKGKVTNYKIQYKRKGVPRGDLCTVTTNSWKREYMLTDLLKGEIYKVRVAAKTGKITGPTSDWISVQLAGKRGSGRDQSDSGLATSVLTTLSPEENVRPPPPADAFMSIQKTSLLVSWLPPHQEYRTLVRFYQLDIYRGSDMIIREQLDAERRNFTLPNFDKDVDHTVYLTAVNRMGASDFLQRTYKPLSDDKSWSAVSDLRAHPLSSTSVLVEWSPPISGLLTRYLVRYRPTSNDETTLKDEWLGPSHNNYAILGLQRFQEYKISVIPFLNEINGNESFVIVKTLSTRPTAPPQNVTLTSVNFTTITLSWEPPPSFTRNGILIVYRIAYRRTDQNQDSYVNVDTSANNASISDLLSGTTYEVRIAAVNINGTGPYSDSISVTTLESPKDKSLPGKPRNLTVSPVPYGVALQWSPPGDSGIPVTGYIVGHGRFIPEVYRETIGANVLKYRVVKLRKNQDYIFSVRAFNDNGESPAVFIIATADDEPRKLKAELTNNEVPTIRVSWEPPKEARDTIQGYLVNYKVKGESTWHAILERSQVAEIKNLSFDTTYYIRVQLQYMDGGVGRMSKLLKVKTRSLDDIILVLPTPIITSVFSGTDHLLVSWKPPPSDFLHIVVGYVLGYGESDISDHQEFISVSERSFRIGKLKADTQYLISLRMFNEFGESARTIVNANTSSK